MNEGTAFDITGVLVAALQEGNERPGVEFKEYVDPDKEDQRDWLLRAIAAMANGEAQGFIFVGVADRPRPAVIGLQGDILTKYDRANIYRKVAAFLCPVPRVDVHRITYEGLELVAIAVAPFAEIPSFVSQSFGGYSAGSILLRTPGGETAPASKEGDIRALCQRIVAKHREQVASYVRTYLKLAGAPATQGEQERPEQESLEAVRKFAFEFWAPGRPCIEVFFAPCTKFQFDRTAFKAAFPSSCIATANLGTGFPTRARDVADIKSRGWLMTLPIPDSDARIVADYVWAMHTSWAFVDLDRFWEDEGRRPIHGGVGIMHLATRVCLLLRFLRRIGVRFALDRSQRFLVGVRLRGVRGRYLASEYLADNSMIQRADEDDIEISRTVHLAELDVLPESGPSIPAVVLDLLEDAGWRLGRTDLQATVYPQAIATAAERVESAVLFPRQEDVQVFSP